MGRAGIMVVLRLRPREFQVAEIWASRYHYNQAVHALNAIAYYLKRDEADSLDALDALEHATGKLEAVDAGVQAIREQLNSLVGKRFGYELFKPNKYENPHNMQERKRQNEDIEASR